MRPSFAALVLPVLVACAKGPLPGDSVDPEGGVRLSPPRPTSPVAASRPSEPVGAIEARLFPPDLVMDHQAAIGLTGAQRDAITKEIDRGQGEVTKLQWELQAEKERLVKDLSSDRVDEAKAQETAARLMGIESRVKAAHLGMLVRIKNLLTPAQQTQLHALRDADRCPPGSRAPSPSAR